MQKKGNMLDLTDESVYFKYYDEWLAIAKQEGFKTVSDAIKSLYKDKKSQKAVGAVFSVSGRTIGCHLQRLHVQCQPRGGAHGKGRKTVHFVGDTPLTVWCKEHNVPIGRIYQRLRYGWSLRRAISTPLQEKLS